MFVKWCSDRVHIKKNNSVPVIIKGYNWTCCPTLPCPPNHPNLSDNMQEFKTTVEQKEQLHQWLLIPSVQLTGLFNNYFSKSIFI